MRVAIIGAGAAGLMTAATILELHPEVEVFLIEKNNGLGKKVIISGGGRCNVTTGVQDIRSVLGKYPRGAHFLSASMHQFSPEMVFAWFEMHGVPLKIEDDLRVFPQSDDGNDIVGVFQQLFEEASLKPWLSTQVQSIQKVGKTFQIYGKQMTDPLTVDTVVLTTGGQAYRQTGSTGDGYAFACSLGHTLTPLAPSLNAFTTRETWPQTLSGLSFHEATLTVQRPKKTHITGPFLFTHKGLSGPAVFALSSHVAFEMYDAIDPLLITIDLFPDTTPDQLSQQLHHLLHTQPKKALLTVFAQRLPRSFVEVICQELTLATDTRAAEISKNDLHRIVSWLKAIPLSVIGRGAGDEFVTAGGIDTREVNPHTMESKITPGLFFAGEILDIDGYTGGFNLQASWATGRLAGSCVSSGESAKI